MKICSKCSLRKDYSEFGKDKTKWDGYYPSCKACKRKKDYDWVSRNRDKVLGYSNKMRQKYAEANSETPPSVDFTKTCPGCNTEKSAKAFPKKIQAKDGRSTYCRACSKSYRERIKSLEKDVPEEKQCSKCGLVKQSSEFFQALGKLTGLSSQCKDCEADRKAKFYEENREAIRERVNSKPKTLAQRAAVSLYKKRLKMAMPKNLSEAHKEEIKLIYKSAKARSEFHEIQYDVDHIEPIKGKTSCGLHVPWNLRIITATQNRKKHNKLIT